MFKKENSNENHIKPSDMVSPWLVSDEVTTAPSKSKELIIRRSVITTQL